MKTPIELVESHPTTVATATAMLPFLFPQVRAFFRMLLRKIFARGHKIDLILSEVIAIKSEIRFSNDTSTKQEVEFLKNRQHSDFWRSARPAIELDGDAKVMHVSETLCRLLGVSTPSDLYLRNWLRFVNGPGVDDFLAAFADCVKFQSSCDFPFHLKTKDELLLGEWKLITSPISPPGYAKMVYTGFFKPIDARAREVADGLHWSK